jgi:hypothetical protein
MRNPWREFQSVYLGKIFENSAEEDIGESDLCFSLALRLHTLIGFFQQPSWQNALYPLRALNYLSGAAISSAIAFVRADVSRALQRAAMLHCPVIFRSWHLFESSASNRT